MAYYSLDEINDILIKLSQEAPAEIKFKKHERLGILINNPAEEEIAKAVVQDDVPLYACSVCKKKLISAHLLDLHVVENHDSYFDLQKDKKPMYACYLEECKHSSQSPEERKDHCIKDHKFPHDFRFDCGSKKKSVDDQRMDTSEVTAAAPAKPKITNFHFGNKSQKVFKGGYKKIDPLETMNVDMKESLPEV